MYDTAPTMTKFIWDPLPLRCLAFVARENIAKVLLNDWSLEPLGHRAFAVRPLVQFNLKRRWRCLSLCWLGRRWKNKCQLRFLTRAQELNMRCALCIGTLQLYAWGFGYPSAFLPGWMDSGKRKMTMDISQRMLLIKFEKNLKVAGQVKVRSQVKAVPFSPIGWRGRIIDNC